jgi:hypothetical protein
MLFDVPHRPDPMTAKQIRKEYPNFAKLMDGACTENTLLFYYKKEKTTEDNVAIHYVFQDEIAEEDIADMMGVEVGTFSYDVEPLALRALTETEKVTHLDNISMIREGLTKMNVFCDSL